MADARSVREFPFSGDPWPAVDRWAESQGYRVTEQSGSTRTYQKGSGLLVAPRMVEVAAGGQGLRISAWVRVNLVQRIMSAFILPPEITFASGGAKAIIPRKMGRGEVNPLLADFGQPPIS